MSIAFSRSMRALNTSRHGRSTLSLILAIALLGVWISWVLLARVTLYEVSNSARLEVDSAAHVIQSPVSGRVVYIRNLSLAEEQIKLDVLAPRIETLRSGIQAQEQALSEARRTGEVAIEEARAKLRESEAAAQFARADAGRAKRLKAEGLLSQTDLERASAELEKREASSDALRHAIERLEREYEMAEQDRQTQIEQLRGELTQLEGEERERAAAIKRLKKEIENRLIKSPVGGRVGEVAELQIGAFIREGDKLGAVIPEGSLRIVAEFSPASALGRIRAGQPAIMRLDGFPWNQYGAVSATVSRVASEPRDGRVRIEMIADPTGRISIPLQHGLPGTVEVEVESVSPAMLALRAAGRIIAAPPNEAAKGRLDGK
jgi:membrane fusion protein (multidrug efflux system)